MNKKQLFFQLKNFIIPTLLKILLILTKFDIQVVNEN